MKNIFLSVNDVGVIIINNFSKPFIEWSSIPNWILIAEQSYFFLCWQNCSPYKNVCIFEFSNDSVTLILTVTWVILFMTSCHNDSVICTRIILIQFYQREWMNEFSVLTVALFFLTFFSTLKAQLLIETKTVQLLRC